MQQPCLRYLQSSSVPRRPPWPQRLSNGRWDWNWTWCLPSTSKHRPAQDHRRRRSSQSAVKRRTSSGRRWPIRCFGMRPQRRWHRQRTGQLALNEHNIDSSLHCTVFSKKKHMCSCSWDARQHQFNFVYWPISSDYGENSLYKYVSQPEIAKNLLKPLFLEVQGSWRLSMLLTPWSLSAVLVMISSDLWGRSLHCWNLRLMLTILRAGCLGLSSVISAQFTLEMCVAAWNREKFTNRLFFGFKVVQGHRCWYPWKAHQHYLL